MKENKNINKEHLQILFVFKKERYYADEKLNISLSILFFSLTFVASLYTHLKWEYFISLIIIISIEILLIIYKLLPEIRKNFKNKNNKKIDDDFDIFYWKNWIKYNNNDIQKKYNIDEKIMNQIIKNINVIKRKYFAFKIFAMFVFVDLILFIVFLFLNYYIK